MTFKERMERLKQQHRVLMHHAQLLLHQSWADRLRIRTLLRDSQATLENIRRLSSERRDETGRGEQPAL